MDERQDGIRRKMELASGNPKQNSTLIQGRAFTGFLANKFAPVRIYCGQQGPGMGDQGFIPETVQTSDNVDGVFIDNSTSLETLLKSDDPTIRIQDNEP